MIQRITSTHEDERMPPMDSKKHLTETEIDTLKRWIAEGAEYERHWAFEPIPPPREAPLVEREAWGINSIDGFVLRRLQQEGMRPRREAVRATTCSCRQETWMTSRKRIRRWSRRTRTQSAGSRPRLSTSSACSVSRRTGRPRTGRRFSTAGPRRSPLPRRSRWCSTRASWTSRPACPSPGRS